MNRFKFRVWFWYQEQDDDLPRGYMVYPEDNADIRIEKCAYVLSLNGILYDNEKDNCHLYFEQPYEKHILMQSIGLPDKTNKDIYDGDIVEFEWSTFQGEFFSTCLVEYDELEYKWKLSVIDKDNDEAAKNWNGARGFDFFCVGSKQLLVIGNKFQNPELLGGKE